MKKITLAAFVAALAFASAPAFAGSPDGTFVFKTNTDYTDIGNLVGQYSARIIQNGQFVGGTSTTTIDQTTYPGSRADAVQSLLAVTGQGRNGH